MRKVILTFLFLMFTVGAFADGGSIPLCPPGPNHLPQCNPAGGPKVVLVR